MEEEELKKIKNFFYSESLSDEETKLIIKKIYKNKKILVDPHTAVAIGVVNKIALEKKTVILATAHPAKFPETVMQQADIKPELPGNLKDIFNKKEKYKKLPNDLKIIQKYILERV